MSELQLRQDVVDELEYEPSVDAAHIGVAVDKGVVTLTGHVASYAEKQAAIAAVRRVKGVRAIAEEIEVRYPLDKKTSDDEIAQRAIDILGWDMMVPSDSIQVMVHNGWVTLTGNVDWHYQKKQAEEDVRKLSGVRGVTNTIEIKPSVQAEDVKRKIEEAQFGSLCASATRCSLRERSVAGTSEMQWKMLLGPRPVSSRSRIA
jgi:osmotically-inducible protein OsmY